MTMRTGAKTIGVVSAVVVGFALSAHAATAQKIAFSTDLPRVLVFIQEDGNGQVAAHDMTDFLRKAGFPVIDPALAHEAAQRALVKAAMGGDQGAATELGRDFGAQVLVLGTADWGARPDPVDGSLITATTEVTVRALRLDVGEVVGNATGDARAIEATEQAAKTKAIHEADNKILTTSPMVGAVMNDWQSRPWKEALYWKPDPGAVPTKPDDTPKGEAPGVAILRADVLPAQGVATRGIGVIKKGDGTVSNVRNEVRLEGVVVGPTKDVTVAGEPAILSPLDAGEAARLGIQGKDAQQFSRRFDLPISDDSVKIIATGPGGATTEAVAAPRIHKRYAVVIGVGQYEEPDIPDLKYAADDAQSVYDFLESPAAGPFDDVLFLKDGQATGAAMRQALFVFLQKARWDDLVVIYFAGHGAPDPNRPDNLYLLPTDAKLNALAATGFPMWDVKTALRRQIASDRVLVIADACHSAGTTEDAVGGAKSNAIAGGFAELFSPSRRLIMTAANTNEYSLEDARWGGHGVFTHFLVQGLKGAADENSDGIVTFTELFDYVSKNVRTSTDGRQNPQRSGFGDIPLAVVASPPSHEH